MVIICLFGTIWNLYFSMCESCTSLSGTLSAVTGSILTAWRPINSLSANPLRVFSAHIPGSSPRPGSFVFWGLGGRRPEWPLGFHGTRLPTLPHILPRVINYAGKLLALRGKIAATIWRQPQFLPNPSHICSPAPAPRIHTKAYRVSIFLLEWLEKTVRMFLAGFLSVGILA